MTKQDQYNRIKAVIKNSKNKFIHVAAISKMIRTYELTFGICNLSCKLQLEKTALYART